MLGMGSRLGGDGGARAPRFAVASGWADAVIKEYPMAQQKSKTHISAFGMVNILDVCRASSVNFSLGALVKGPSNGQGTLLIVFCKMMYAAMGS